MNAPVMALAACAALGTAATAQIATFTYSDLVGNYNNATKAFSAVAGAVTSGDVTRLQNPGGSAQFDTGFMTLPTSADVSIMLTIGVPMGGMATANGTFMITDHNGDTFGGDIIGLFSLLGPAITFDGALTNVYINDNSLDGTFDGPSGGAFATDFSPTPAPYEGAIVQLFFSPGNFFSQSFSNTPVLASAFIIPAPASMALVGLGGLAAIRRRR